MTLPDNTGSRTINTQKEHVSYKTINSNKTHLDPFYRRALRSNLIAP